MISKKRDCCLFGLWYEDTLWLSSKQLLFSIVLLFPSFFDLWFFFLLPRQFLILCIPIPSSFYFSLVSLSLPHSSPTLFLFFSQAMSMTLACKPLEKSETEQMRWVECSVAFCTGSDMITSAILIQYHDLRLDDKWNEI